jgi:hypothetical protein
MKGVTWRRALVCACLLGAAGTLARAANYPPADHGGLDLVLAGGDVIWGTHTNINRFVVPTSAVVQVNPYGLDQTYGAVTIHATDIIVSGTLSARGAGHWGGAGGGGGGGASVYGFTGSLTPGRGALGGQGFTDANDGGRAVDGFGAFGTAAPGGAGGVGGKGSGPAGGTGGDIGRGFSDTQGGNGSAGEDGGYFAPGVNGDITIGLYIRMGSGGGGGGGAAGGGAGIPGTLGKIAGGGGGSGASGASGGGAIRLFAVNTLRVGGAVDTRGALLGGGGSPSPISRLQVGNNGQDAIITLLEARGGDGGIGADAAAGAGIDLGGIGGRGLADRATGQGWPGGNGGWAGGAAGGGMVLYCMMQDGMDLTSGTLDARGSMDTLGNGGTVKIFFTGANPTLQNVTIYAGRIYTAYAAAADRWRLYF